MTLTDFIQANSRFKLMKWQLDFLKQLELAKKQNKILYVNTLPRCGRTHFLKLIDKYYKQTNNEELFKCQYQCEWIGLEDDTKWSKDTKIDKSKFRNKSVGGNYGRL